MTDKQIKNQEEAIKMIKKLNEKLKNVDDYVVELRSNFYRMKQDLDRKEQECEELKAELVLFKTSNQTTIDQLKAENEELKKSVLQECPNCGEEYLNYKGAALYFENSDLKQILAEIKEIAEELKNFYEELGKCEGLTVVQLKQILQKINECEGNNG